MSRSRIRKSDKPVQKSVHVRSSTSKMTKITLLQHFIRLAIRVARSLNEERTATGPCIVNDFLLAHLLCMRKQDRCFSRQIFIDEDLSVTRSTIELKSRAVDQITRLPIGEADNNRSNANYALLHFQPMRRRDVASCDVDVKAILTQLHYRLLCVANMSHRQSPNSSGVADDVASE